MSKKKVLVLTTGGTIEKAYSELDGTLENRDSLIKERLLHHLRLPHTEVTLREVMAKDSLEMTDADREVIWRQIEGHFGHDCPIIVLHGTDTMSVTASHCWEREPAPPVPVIFTGAMKPMGFTDSDAPQNIIEALMTCHYVVPGFYISFHNNLFNVPNVHKNKEKGTFEKI